jgi:hypothetical protein
MLRTNNSMRIWTWPVSIGLVTASGLLSALVSDGWGDWWSWAALGIPVAAMAWLALRQRPDPIPDDD